MDEPMKLEPIAIKHPLESIGESKKKSVSNYPLQVYLK